jgi:hypothetical protein
MKKRKQREWDEIIVPPWRDGGAVGDLNKIVKSKRVRKEVKRYECVKK